MFNGTILKKFVNWLLLIVVAVTLSCKGDRKRPDVSSIKVKTQLQRFDQDLFKPGDPEVKVQDLRKKYPHFFPLFVSSIVSISRPDDPGLPTSLQAYLEDPYTLQLKKEISQSFQSFESEFNNLVEAFRYYKYYFPEKSVPSSVITTITHLSYAQVALEQEHAIGLDLYLGPQNDIYPQAGFPRYKSRRMHKAFIVPDAIKAWTITETVFDPTDKNLLAQMLYQGKVLYALDLILPDTDDTLKTGYTEEQLKWCEENEKNLWAYLIDNKLLYSTETKLISRFLQEGPFTSGLPKESAPAVGQWIGWRIVRSYMDRHPDVSLSSLFKLSEQLLLKESKYKP